MALGAEIGGEPCPTCGYTGERPGGECPRCAAAQRARAEAAVAARTEAAETGRLRARRAAVVGLIAAVLVLAACWYLAKVLRGRQTYAFHAERVIANLRSPLITLEAARHTTGPAKTRGLFHEQVERAQQAVSALQQKWGGSEAAESESYQLIMAASQRLEKMCDAVERMRQQFGGDGYPDEQWGMEADRRWPVAYEADLKQLLDQAEQILSREAESSTS